jgi:hypothetical protein
LQRIGAPITFGLVCGIAMFFAANRSALPQAGSAGGTLGKVDKSASGSRDTGEPQSASRSIGSPKSSSTAAATSVAGRWDWTADCPSGHWVGAFNLTQGAAGEFNGAFMQTSSSDIGTISDGLVSNSKISFTRSWTVLLVSGRQRWSGQLGDGARHINGNITGNENCTWKGVKK